MQDSYSGFYTKLKSDRINPQQNLSPYIDKYIFYEINNLQRDIRLKAFSRGKTEVFIHYNSSHLYLYNKEKVNKMESFIAGIAPISKSLLIEPVAPNKIFSGICISLSYLGEAYPVYWILLHQLLLPVQWNGLRFVKTKKL